MDAKPAEFGRHHKRKEGSFHEKDLGIVVDRQARRLSRPQA